MTTQATPPSEALLVVVFFFSWEKFKKVLLKYFFPTGKKYLPNMATIRKSKQSVQLYAYKTLADLVVAIQ